MQDQLLAGLLGGLVVSLGVSGWLARELVRLRRKHVASSRRLALAEWWAKNATEFRHDPASARALEAFAFCALRAPSLRVVAQQIARVADPARVIGLARETAAAAGSGEPQWLGAMRASGNGDALAVVLRARGALGELRHGAWAIDAEPGGPVRWRMRCGDPYDRDQGGYWQRADLELAAAAAVDPLCETAAEALRGLCVEADGDKKAM